MAGVHHNNDAIEIKRFNAKEVRDFLELLWGLYTSYKDLWFEIRIIGDGKARSYWFRNHEEAVAWLNENWDRLELWKKHVYFGVLPRELFDESELDERYKHPVGGGKSKHVARALYLFADLDYKQVVQREVLPDKVSDELDKTGYFIVKDDEDGFEAYFKVNKKVVHVKKPNVDAVLKHVKERLGLEPSLIVDSGYGYHVYVKLSHDVDVQLWRKLQRQLIDILGADQQTKDPARILRLPGTYNPRFYPHLRRVETAYYEAAAEYKPEELEKKLQGAQLHTEKKSPSKPEETQREQASQHAARRKLSEQEISRAADILKNYWVVGHRDSLELGLVGWMWKAGIDYDSAYRVIEKICDAASDEEKEKRLSELERQWRLFETGQKKPEAILGKAGVLEELERVLREQNPGLSDEESRDRALAVVSELEKLLGPRRSILIRTPYATNVFFVNDPQRGIVLLRERVDSEGNVHRYREYISDWYVVKVAITKTEGAMLYKILFRNARTREKLVLRGSIDEIARELVRIHGIKRSSVVRDAVSSLVSEFRRRKLAKVMRAAEAAGIVPVRDGVRLVRTGVLSVLLAPRSADHDAARHALELLEKLRAHYDEMKFDVVLSWAAYAPAGYALKKLYHVKQLYVLLCGEKHTGKTTLARIVTSLYPVAVPEEAGSEYRMGWKLNATTLVVFEDEVQGINSKPGLVALLKRAATGIVARWRGDTHRVYRARAALIMASNEADVVLDPALAERMITLLFTRRDYVYSKPREKLEEFKKLYNEYIGIANTLGLVVLETLVEKWGEIARTWAHRLQEKVDYIALGQAVWRWVAEKLGVPPPSWATAEITLHEENPEQREHEMVFEILHDTIRDVIARYKQFTASHDVWGRIVELYRAGVLPGWIHPRRHDVVVTATLVEELRRRYRYTPPGGLPGLAARLGYKYGPVKVGRRSVKGMIIPGDVLVEAVETEDEKAERLANIYIAQFMITDKTPDESTVVEMLVHDGLDEDEARRIAPLIVEKIERIMREERGEPAL